MEREKIKIYSRGRKKENRSLLRGVVIGALVTSLIIGGIKYKIDTNTKPKDNMDNERGYSSVNFLYNDLAKSNEFVIINAGNYNNRTLYIDSNIKYCNENDISLGVVIDSNAKNIYQIYDEIEYAKALISTYSIDFPIYISIDKIMENRDLNPMQKSNLVSLFLNKAIENKIYVGVCGTDTNLCNFNKYCFDLSEYNVYLKKETDQIKYPNNCDLIEDLNRNIINTNKKNFPSIIKNEKYNDRSNFIQDAYYIVKENDSIDTIALQFGLSVNDLLKYNEILEKNIEKDTLLRIPTYSQNILKTFKKNITEKAIKCGVDLSTYQTQIDWSTLSNNVDFAILKATESTRDSQAFESQYEACKENDIPIGIYSVTRAKSIEEIKEEAYKLVEVLKGKNITYPVYIDFEVNLQNEDEFNVWNNMTQNNGLTKMLDAWFTIINDAGYIPGIYCNKSLYREIYNLTDTKNNNYLNKFENWIAGSTNYSNPCDFNGINDPGSKTSYQDVNIVCNMRQVSEACVGIGAGTEAGYVDFNYCYTDYENCEYTCAYTFDIKGLDTKNIREILINSSGALVIVSMGIMYIYLKRKINNSKKNHSNNKSR